MLCLLAQHTESPLRVRRQREAPAAVLAIGNLQHGQLHRVRGCHADRQARRHPIALVAEDRPARPMLHLVGRVAPHRRGGHAPELPSFLVAQVERLAHGVRDRVVRPRRESEEIAAPRPRESPAALGDHKTALRIGNHVRPRRRRNINAAHGNTVVALRCEPAMPVPRAELPLRVGRLHRSRPTAALTHRKRRVARPIKRLREVLGNAPQRAPITRDAQARNSRNHLEVRRTKRLAIPHMHAARGIEHRRSTRRKNQLLDPRLQVLDVSLWLVDHHDEINGDAA